MVVCGSMCACACVYVCVCLFVKGYRRVDALAPRRAQDPPGEGRNAVLRGEPPRRGQERAAEALLLDLCVCVSVCVCVCECVCTCVPSP